VATAYELPSEPLSFIACGTMISSGGILVNHAQKNAVHSALAMIIPLPRRTRDLPYAVFPVVAGVQIILYAGVIMVLVLFVIMLIRLAGGKQKTAIQHTVAASGTAATALGGLFIAAYTDHHERQGALPSGA